VTEATWSTLVRHPSAVSEPGSACDRLIDRQDDGQVAAWARTIESPETRQHYHRQSAELHYVLAGQGLMHLDGRAHEVQAGSLVHVPPGVIHSASGAMRVLVVGVPFIAEEDTFYLDEM